MRKIACLSGLILGFFILSTTLVFAANPRLYFDVSDIGVKQGDEFELSMKIDAASNAVSGADAVLEYNPTYLEVVSIDNGNFFPLFGKHFEINNQKIYITGFFTEKNQTKVGEGQFAKLTFKAVQNGVTSLKFDCTQKSLSDTNIINLASNDLVVCRDLAPVKISVAGSNYTIAASGFGKILGTESGALTTVTPTPIPNSNFENVYSGVDVQNCGR